MSAFYLFSSKSCPYAHRCEIAIKLLNISSLVEVVYCDPLFTFKDKWKIIGSNNPTPYTLLADLYTASQVISPMISLPVLYDNSTKKILSTDSMEVIKILHDYQTPINLLPSGQTDFFDKFNTCICIGTYKAGHAKTPEDYQKFFNMMFDYLDWLEDDYLKDKIYISSDNLSILDIIVYCHLIRFDLIFYSLFALNKKHLWEFPNICRYLKSLSTIPEFRDATDIEEIKRGGYLTENNLPQNLGCIKVPMGKGGMEKYY